MLPLLEVVDDFDSHGARSYPCDLASLARVPFRAERGRWCAGSRLSGYWCVIAGVC